MAVGRNRGRVRLRRGFEPQGAIVARAGQIVELDEAPELGAAIARQRLPFEIGDRIAGSGKYRVERNVDEDTLVETAFPELLCRYVRPGCESAD